MNRRSITFLIIAIAIILVGFYFYATADWSNEGAETSVRDLVLDFGERLQNVSLLAPTSTLLADIETSYGEFISPELLAAWKNNPREIPGRLTSSPWPDRIQIQTIEEVNSLEYRVEGDIVEVTNEAGGLEDVLRRPVSLTIQKIGEKWLITALTLGAFPSDGLWQYSSTTSQGLQFFYPNELTTEYILTEEWPPDLTTASGTFSCAPGNSTSSSGLSLEKIRRTVDDRSYCVTIETEGAAGSIYRSYTYTGAYLSGRLANLTFTLRYPECANYDIVREAECESEREAFDLDGVVDRMISSIRAVKSFSIINSFEECAAAGYPIMESYPEQCRTPDGRNFVRKVN